jgi:putative transposase
MPREDKWGQTPFASKWGLTPFPGNGAALLADIATNLIDPTWFAECENEAKAYAGRMPRPPRLIHADQFYHVLNRANQKATVFRSPGDYDAFIRLMSKAQEQVELRLLAACIMPNHVHLLVQPRADKDITKWMHWLFTTHSRHYNDRNESVGHVWQGRFKACMAQSDQHLLTVARYVERNALRAKLVDAAQDWRWGSLAWRLSARPPIALSPMPMALPTWWTDFVNQPQTAAELEAIRTSVNKQRPYGDPEWVIEQARAAKLGQSLASPGRPRKRRSGTIS